MGEVLKMRPADLIRRANRKEKIETRFEIEIDGVKQGFLLTAPDIFDVLKEQERCYQKEYAVCVSNEMDSMPLNKADWEKELEKLDSDARKLMMEDKPRNLAEQTAKKNSRFDTIRVLLPKKLKDENGELAFPTMQDQAEFGDYIASHPDVMNILTQKYIEIMNKLNEVSKAAKNLPTEQVGTNTGSK